MKMILRFEDRGQDFLEWTLDDQGFVIDCQPFQAWAWCGHRVLDHVDLAVGDFAFICPEQPADAIDRPVRRYVRYPLIAVERVPA